jgi:AraC-like DNA-binding protein
LLIERALSELNPCDQQVRLGLLHELPSTPVVEPARRYGDALEVAAHAAWSSYLVQAAKHPPLDARFSWMPSWQAPSSRTAQDQLIAVFHAALAATRSEATALPKRCVARLAFDALMSDPTLSRHALSRRLDVSEGHLSRRFPEIFGASLVSQRARLRLTRFLTLAKASHSANLLHSALEAGFGSYAQLHRVFTCHSSFSPSGYLQGRGLLAAGTVVRAN